ncbi:MAG: UDP-N-acetylmuramate--L-alanine ligase [Firmicutes bacterium]|jgi:UDP-N-acetylmuramate--alanine ligase|nr:UDP-N-acetylmuramate--L-alanine ligase [Bacillota bacterium]
MWNGKRVHFIGVGGSGMSPLARILSGMGARVSGSDIKPSPKLSEVSEAGVEVYTGHDPARVHDAELVVVSAAVPPDDPELRAAKEAGIHVVTRAELLGELMNPARGIAVTGTHGKTTTSSMVALSLERAGLDPTIVVGASVPKIPGGGKLGRGEFVVVEADEAYGSFLRLTPEVAVVTSIDDDHRDYYSTFEGILEGFAQFLRRIKPGGTAVVCADDPNTGRAVSGLRRRIVTYGFAPGADYTAASSEALGFGSRFEVVHRGRPLGKLELAVPGVHNISNALAASAVCDLLGVDFGAVRDALRDFTGAERRCQILARTRGVTVVDDYAHHPAEIRATLSALRRATSGRLVAVFQPHRFTRTKLLMDEFARSFGNADVIGVTEIFYEGTGEQPIAGLSGKELCARISAFEGREATYIPDRGALDEFLRKTVRSGDIVVTMGAGDIYRASRKYADELLDGSTTPR